jgi:hypothetical protein
MAWTVLETGGPAPRGRVHSCQAVRVGGLAWRPSCGGHRRTDSVGHGGQSGDGYPRRGMSSGRGRRWLGSPGRTEYKGWKVYALAYTYLYACPTASPGHDGLPDVWHGARRLVFGLCRVRLHPAPRRGLSGAATGTDRRPPATRCTHRGSSPFRRPVASTATRRRPATQWRPEPSRSHRFDSGRDGRYCLPLASYSTGVSVAMAPRHATTRRPGSALPDADRPVCCPAHPAAGRVVAGASPPVQRAVPPHVNLHRTGAATHGGARGARPKHVVSTE